MDYPTLRGLIEKQGLLNKTPWYYARATALLIAFFTSAWILYYHVQNTYLQISTALLLGFLGVRFGLIGHDASHQAISQKPLINRLLGNLGMTIINGVSLSYWTQNHNTHHKNPNCDPKDPDIDYLISFNQEQAKKRKHLMKYIARYQAILFTPIQALSTFSMTFNSIKHFFKKKPQNRSTEIPTLLLHLGLWIVIPSLIIGPYKAILLYLTATLFRGLYFSMVFVPNHVGMPTYTQKDRLNFYQKQTQTSRNLTPSLIKDYLFGGLNYQIEHHLFPTMSRKYLKKAKPIVQEYCQTHKIPYKETGFFKAYQEIFRHLYAVGRLA